MPADTYRPWIAGAPHARAGRASDEIRNPFDDSVVARAEQADAADLELALTAAVRGAAELRALPRHTRRDILEATARRLTAERDALAALIVREGGKPVSQALGEVDRAALTFSFAADEARRWGGEVLPLDVDPRTPSATAIVSRFAAGPVAAISPFNFPLNLVAHKLAPAIAVGASVVLKPPPQDPGAAFALARILREAGLPADALSVLHLPIPLAERLATDDRMKVLSFTGSAAVGWHLKAAAPKKRVLLELGGNAAAIIHEDAGDLASIAARVAAGAFAYAGQVCIKVQRVLVHRPVAAAFTEALLRATRALPVGDPADPRTVVGPMIDARNADRVEAWVDAAEAAGAVRLERGPRRRNVVAPIVLTSVPHDAKVWAEEVFGPVLVVEPYDTFDGALGVVNDSRYGLQAGVFTRDVRRIWQAFERLEVGGVIANDYPTLRVDTYPYGGVKDSGFGREGVRYAMEEMSELRTLVLAGK
ncbi:MAG TPA: aldehyde dehydrogenase family protein [Gemmatimonadales bacterium]|nr:aldehyde dehydrogenase family protein [Gemmatimonadales bacterium]